MPIVVICDESEAQHGDWSGVAFSAFVSVVPRTGESVLLEDGRQCEVTRVYHKAVTLQVGDDVTLVSMLCQVYAKAID